MIRLGERLANEHEPELGSAYLPLEIRSQALVALCLKVQPEYSIVDYEM